MYDVTNIHYSPGDIIIFTVDTDSYDVEEIAQVAEQLKKQAPDIKALFIPEDMVEEILVLNKDVLAFNTVDTTLYSPQPTAYPAYLSGIMNSDSNLSNIKGDTKW